MAPVPENQIKSELALLKDRKLPVIFVGGGPGAGKGTQCSKLAEKYNFKHISSGDLLRDDIKSGKPRGIRLETLMLAGIMAPLEVVFELIEEAIVCNKNSKGFLMDGFPRDVAQGEKFEDEILDCSLFIYFDASDATMTQRVMRRALTSGRVDDNAESIKKRLVTFHDVTKPVVDYYGQKGKLVVIKAEGTVDEIFNEACKAIDKVLF